MNNHKLVSRFTTHNINKHIEVSGSTQFVHSYALGVTEAKIATILNKLEYSHPEAYLTAVDELMVGVV